MFLTNCKYYYSSSYLCCCNFSFLLSNPVFHITHPSIQFSHFFGYFLLSFHFCLLFLHAFSVTIFHHLGNSEGISYALIFFSVGKFLLCRPANCWIDSTGFSISAIKSSVVFYSAVGPELGTVGKRIFFTEKFAIFIT